MKKLLLISTVILLTSCSALDMGKQHRIEKKELRGTYREQIRPIEESYCKDKKKLETKQALQFGVLVANKIRLLKEFFK
ncbi:MAG: hypothetical protein ACRC6U_08090 [Fusobacteriaceae bacterium]